MSACGPLSLLEKKGDLLDSFQSSFKSGDSLLASAGDNSTATFCRKIKNFSEHQVRPDLRILKTLNSPVSAASLLAALHHESALSRQIRSHQGPRKSWMEVSCSASSSHTTRLWGRRLPGRNSRLTILPPEVCLEQDLVKVPAAFHTIRMFHVSLLFSC